MEADPRAHRTKVLLAFFCIYFVWGSSFLAIKIGVAEVPPFLFAGMRFLIAGVALFGWMLARGARMPARREWGEMTLLAVLIFVCDYGLLFWADGLMSLAAAAVFAMLWKGAREERETRGGMAVEGAAERGQGQGLGAPWGVPSFLYAGHDSGLVGLKSPVGRESGTSRANGNCGVRTRGTGSRRQDYRHHEQEPNRRPPLAGQGSNGF